jgi:hypothetical protein
MMRVTNQSHRLAGSAKPRLNLRAYGDPLHIPSEHVCQEVIALMSSVETNLVTEEAPAYAQTK